MAGNDQANAGAEKQAPLFSRNFILLFLLALFSNCFLAIYYCFEQWLAGEGVAPGSRGLLLAAFFATVMLTRPFATVFLMRVSKFPAVLVSLGVISGVLASYRFLPAGWEYFESAILVLRLVQGVFMAVFSTACTAVFAKTIPPSQSARGFAIYSLTILLPFAVIPTLGETLIPVLGGEAGLFALTGCLFFPCALIACLLGESLREVEIAKGERESVPGYIRRVYSGAFRGGIGWGYVTILAFAMTLSTTVLFMKGLCGQTGGSPAAFFFFYALTVTLLRLFANRLFNSMAKFPALPLHAALMGGSVLLMAYGPSWCFIPGGVLYSVALSFLYPLAAAAVFDRTPPEGRAVCSNTQMLMFDISSLTSPVLGGVILAMGLDYRAVMAFGACLAFLSAVSTCLDKTLNRLDRNMR